MSEFIDYSSRDFSSVREDLLARARVVMPEWTTQDSADFGTMLVDLWAYAADVIHYYVDRAANESFLQTAVLRASLLNLASLFDYRPVEQTAAAATVTFTRGNGVTGDIAIPAGTKVYALAADPNELPIFFETDAAATLLSANQTVNVAVTEGTTVTEEEVGTSGGQTLQTYRLYFSKIIGGSIKVYVYEGAPDGNGNPTAVEWLYVDRIIDNAANANVFTTFVDERGTVSVIFGDGVTGRIPPTNTRITATYRYGVGAFGNVGAGAIANFSTNITGLVRVANAAGATGGSDRESMDSLRSSIPKALRAQDRAVTLDDYASLAMKVVGVTKANSYWTIGTPDEVFIYICPSSAVAPSTQLKNDVDAYVTERAVLGKTVTVSNPTYVPINITVSIVVKDNYVRQWVDDEVTAALTALLDFDKQDFLDRFQLGEVYRTVFEVEGVDYFTVDVVSKTGSGVTDIQGAYNEVFTPGTITVTATGGLVGP